MAAVVVAVAARDDYEAAAVVVAVRARDDYEAAVAVLARCWKKCD